MADDTETMTTKILCPDCDSPDVVKNGFQNGQQRYRCKPCDNRFRYNGKPEGRQFQTEHICSAVRMFYMGMSYKQIAETMEKQHDIREPSKQTIYAWVKAYTDTGDLRTDVAPNAGGGDSERICKVPDCSERTMTNRRHYCAVHHAGHQARRNKRRRLERRVRNYQQAQASGIGPPGKGQMEPRNQACPQCGKRGVKIDADGKYRICLSCGWNHYVMEEWE